MGLFDLFKKKKQNDGDENAQVAAYAQKMCCGAVEYAKSFGKNFDFSENSITDLEEILDFYSNDISVSKPTENQIWSMAVIFGSYLGQTILPYITQMIPSTAILSIGFRGVEPVEITPVNAQYADPVGFIKN